MAEYRPLRNGFASDTVPTTTATGAATGIGALGSPEDVHLLVDRSQSESDPHCHPGIPRVRSPPLLSPRAISGFAERVPPEWAVLLLGCALGLATGASVVLFNLAVREEHVTSSSAHDSEPPQRSIIGFF